MGNARNDYGFCGTVINVVSPKLLEHSLYLLISIDTIYRNYSHYGPMDSFYIIFFI